MYFFRNVQHLDRQGEIPEEITALKHLTYLYEVWLHFLIFFLYVLLHFSYKKLLYCLLIFKCLQQDWLQFLHRCLASISRELVCPPIFVSNWTKGLFFKSPLLNLTSFLRFLRNLMHLNRLSQSLINKSILLYLSDMRLFIV